MLENTTSSGSYYRAKLSGLTKNTQKLQISNSKNSEKKKTQLFNP